MTTETTETPKARVLGTLRSLVGRFRRPRYVMGWDLGKDRDCLVKSRIRADGTIEIIDHGVNEHKTANAAGQTPAAQEKPHE